jgi:hypothetical protein
LSQLQGKAKTMDSAYFETLLKRATDATEFTKGKTNALMKSWTFVLTTAGEQTINLQGNFIYGFEGTDGVANIDVQFSRKDSSSDVFNIVKGVGYTHPFDKIHVSWTAQANKTLTIYIANLAPELFGVTDNRSAIIASTLLQNILDEMQGSVTPLNYDVVTLNSNPKIVVASNTSRKSVLIQAHKSNASITYIGFSASVTTSKYVIALSAGDVYAIDDYRGDIYASNVTATDKVSYGEV